MALRLSIIVVAFDMKREIVRTFVTSAAVSACHNQWGC